MAGISISNFSPADVNIQAIIQTALAVRRGVCSVKFCNTNKPEEPPKIFAGSRVEIKGDLYEYQKNTPPENTASEGRNYIISYIDNGFLTTEFTASLPVFNKALNGWYDAATGAKRYIGVCEKTPAGQYLSILALTDPEDTITTSAVTGLFSSYTLSAGGSATLAPIATDGSIFAVNGTGGYILKSTDGINWSSTGVAGSGGDIIYGNGIFIAATNPIKTSLDGSAWTVTGAPGFVNGRMAFGNDVFVMACPQTASGWSAIGLYVSVDGSSWTNQLAGVAVWSVCFGNGIFVASGYSGGIYYIYHSFDGATWTQGISDTYSRAVSYGNGVFIWGTSWFSYDGVNWIANSSSSRPNVIFYGLYLTFFDRFFVVFKTSAPGGSPPCYISQDGRTWTPDWSIPDAWSMSHVTNHYAAIKNNTVSAGYLYYTIKNQTGIA